ncbi:hypothetical protein EI94DRAFT_1733354 [Lactarius quietus]|nr:hypothetical protein EI94DRAFT_1733354 [Lactarius quietus]
MRHRYRFISSVLLVNKGASSVQLGATPPLTRMMLSVFPFTRCVKPVREPKRRRRAMVSLSDQLQTVYQKKHKQYTLHVVCFSSQ